MTENWVSLSNLGFPSYQVSDLGQVRNAKTNYIIKQQKHNNYMQVTIYDSGGKRITKMISGLVMGAFVGPKPDESITIDHINRDTCNNRLCNLRYVTRKEQNDNRIVPETRKGRPVVQYDLQGNPMKIWPRIKDAAGALGLDKTVITKVCRGKLPDDCYFIWRYYVEYYPDEKWVKILYSGVNDFYASSFCHGLIHDKGVEL